MFSSLKFCKNAVLPQALIVPSTNPAQRIVAMGSALSIGLTAASFTPIAFAQEPLNPEIKVGIIQRFGQKKDDKLTIEAMPGDQLTLSFPTNNEIQTITASKIEFDIQMKPLSEPEVSSRVVVSTHRSFESAEAKANVLQAQGLQVELAQPNKWQVWGKRDLYVTDQNQLWLLNQVRQRGFPNAFIAQKKVAEKPQLSWTSGGFRYHRDEVLINSGTQQFLVNKDRFAGQLYFQPNAYGSYTLVNDTPLETYLRGVVPYEIGHNAPSTAVQAQAIIARTYALRNLRRFKVDNYELCATTQCQVYKGLDASTPSVDSAIAATTGQVLTYNNELIDALYSSQTGGVTAQFEDVWEGVPRPYLQSRIDAVPNQVWNLESKPLSDENNFREFIGLKQGFNEDTWSSFRWKKESSLKQVNQNLRAFLKAEQHPLQNFGTIQNIEVAQRSRGGRVQKLTVITDQGNVELTKDEILRAFEAPNSLLFYVQPKSESVTSKSGTPAPGTKAGTSDSTAPGTETAIAPQTEAPSGAAPGAAPTAIPVAQQKLIGFTFSGGGLGHAVGLSQAGSYRLSKIGYSAADILEFYYAGTQLEPLTSSVVYWRDTSATQQQPTPQPQENTVEDESAGNNSAGKNWEVGVPPGEDEPGPEIFGIKLPQVRLSMLWEWIPFLNAG